MDGVEESVEANPNGMPLPGTLLLLVVVVVVALFLEKGVVNPPVALETLTTR